MGKQSRPPPKRLPAEVRLRNLAVNYEQLRGQYERMRRFLWMSVHAAGGRVEIHPDVYKSTMDAPRVDTIVGVEVDKGRNKVVLVFQDEEGRRLPESEPKLIIEA